MYWIISRKDYVTLATTQVKEVAEKLAETFINEDCFVRWYEIYNDVPFATLKELRGEN